MSIYLTFAGFGRQKSFEKAILNKKTFALFCLQRSSLMFSNAYFSENVKLFN